MTHIAIYTTNRIHKKELFEAIKSNRLLFEHTPLNGKIGAVFSTDTINKIIEDEYKHDEYPIQTSENNSLESMSSGQQKIALAQYLFRQNPDYIILDDVHSSLDSYTLEYLVKEIYEHADVIQYIQICYRKEDVLPCVQTVLCIDENLRITDVFSTEEFSLQSSVLSKQRFSAINARTAKNSFGYSYTYKTTVFIDIG
ncbi:MAG: ABC transporter ATP-binding protein [Bacteroidales bacterium]